MVKINNITWSLQDDIVYNNIALCLYATGCAWNCKGCYNKELWDFNHPGSFLLSAEGLTKYLEEKTRYIPEDSISIVGMGGDFWYQLDNFIELINNVKAKFPNIKVVWYTGAHPNYRPDKDLSMFDTILWGKLTNRDGKVYKTVTHADTNHEIEGEVFVNDYDQSFEETEPTTGGLVAYA